MSGPNAPMTPTPSDPAEASRPEVPAVPDGFEGNGPTVHPVGDASEDVTA